MTHHDKLLKAVKKLAGAVQEVQHSAAANRAPARSALEWLDACFREYKEAEEEFYNKGEK